MRHLALRVRGRAIDVAVVEDRRATSWLIPHRPASIRRLVKLVGTMSRLRACCEEGPAGYALFWQLAAMGVACDVVAPVDGTVEQLASAHRDGAVTLVWTPAAALAALHRLGRSSSAATSAW